MNEVPLMSDVSAVPSTVSTASAGQLLRSAREATGLHIVALAAALKVPVRKLEALEADRWDELTDATFVRALAGSVARHLKIDVAPILQALPAGKTAPIEVPDNLGRASAAHAQFGAASGIPKVTWFVLAFLVAALAMYLLPDATFKSIPGFGNSAASDTSAAPKAFPLPAEGSDAPAAVSQGDGAAQGKGVVEQPDVVVKSNALPLETGQAPATAVEKPTAVAVTTPTAVTASPVPLPNVTGGASNTVVTIKAVADTWIEVTGQDGKLRAQRLLKQGDAAEFDDSPLFAVVLGNAAGARVWIKGNAFDLAPVAKNNIARFEAK
jgi:cytoskeleton protein RodZ